MADFVVEHDEMSRRFIVDIGGLEAYAGYEILGDELSGGVLSVSVTYVPRPMEGRGVAAALVEACYAYADSVGLGRAASCSYAVAWLARHPKA